MNTPADRKKIFAAAVLAAGLLLPTSASFAGPHWDEFTWQVDSSYPQDGDHPLRIVHYFVHPVGKALEITVTRPLAWMAEYVAPFQHIDSKGFTGCSRERPARSCQDVIK